MTLLREIFVWTQSLPAWQSDAVARLLAKNQLEEQDEADLLALLKTSAGIVDSERRIPKPLSEAQIPAPLDAGKAVLLHALKNLSDVNAIAPSQTLNFATSGLTVIYGSNGSGKSGYSRVFKRACRARDQQEAIHPNARLERGDVGIPKATFEISVEGIVQELEWRYDALSPDALSSISVFDSRCAKAYLEKEDDFAYVPYGLEVFQSLAQAFQRLKAKIDQEIVGATVDLGVFANLRGDTRVGKLISTLSAKSKPELVKELAALDEREVARRVAITTSLRENNPLEKAKLLRQRVSRLTALAARMLAAQSRVSDEAVTALRSAATAYRTAKLAAELAAQSHQQQDKWLPGTGGEAWRELYEAARRFAVQAYPDKALVSLDGQDACLLCQQPLEEGAARMHRFEAFVEAEAEKLLLLKKNELAALYVHISKVPVAFGLDEAIELEISSENETLLAIMKSFEKALLTRQELIVAAAVGDEWDSIPDMAEGPHGLLMLWIERLDGLSKELEAASDEKAREELQREVRELDARVQLGIVKDSVLGAIETLSRQAKLKACLPALRTNGISNKSAEIAERVVSKELADALNREFKALGVTGLSVSSQSRSERGKTLHRLRLELPQARMPSEILSEGEQRAIALGSFLAEVALSGQSGGVIFDDPVCSLDHLRRERVAARLVEEAERRQVIVFTHDIYFLNLLNESAGRCDVPVLTQSLTSRAQGFGVASSELPFEGKNSRQRVGAIKDIHVRADKAYRQGEDAEHRELTTKAYFQLRLAWERSVEEVLFRGVVVRFRKSIETQRLSEVTVFDADYAAIEAGMSKCSNYAHDKAEFGGIAVPEPDELLGDIRSFEEFIKEVNARSESTRSLRKKRT